MDPARVFTYSHTHTHTFTEKDKSEFDARLHREREQIRALETALNDIRARSTNTTEILQKAYAEERVFLEHVRKLKASFVNDRAMLEQELARVRQAVMQERQMREEAVRRLVCVCCISMHVCICRSTCI